jgi:hypothetical protein
VPSKAARPVTGTVAGAVPGPVRGAGSPVRGGPGKPASDAVRTAGVRLTEWAGENSEQIDNGTAAVTS